MLDSSDSLSFSENVRKSLRESCMIAPLSALGLMVCFLLFLNSEDNLQILVNSISAEDRGSETTRRRDPYVSQKSPPEPGEDDLQTQGEWILNQHPQPLYTIDCPYISSEWRCPHFNISDRVRLRWQPRGGKHQQFDARTFLSRMAGKRLAFFGDSLGRQQFQSLMCALSSNTSGAAQIATDVIDDWIPKRSRGSGAYLLSPSQITVVFFFIPTLCRIEDHDLHQVNTTRALHMDRFLFHAPIYCTLHTVEILPKTLTNPACVTLRCCPMVLSVGRLDDTLAEVLGRLDLIIVNPSHHLTPQKFKLNSWVPYLEGKPVEMPSINDVEQTVLRNVVCQLDDLVRRQAEERVIWERRQCELAESNRTAGPSSSSSDTPPISCPKRTRRGDTNDLRGRRLGTQLKHRKRAGAEHGKGIGEAKAEVIRDWGAPRVPVIYMRTKSPDHFKNKAWDNGGTCDQFNATEVFGPSRSSQDLRLNMTKELLVKTALRGTALRILNISALSELRPGMHPAGDIVGKHVHDDCLHWCLPGVPDTWNEVLLNDIIQNNIFPQ